MTPDVFVRRYRHLVEHPFRRPEGVNSSTTEGLEHSLSFIPTGKGRHELHGRLGLVSRKRARRLKNNRKGKKPGFCRFCQLFVTSDQKRQHEDACRCNPANQSAGEFEQCMYCGAEVPVDYIHEHEAQCSKNPDVILAEAFGCS